MGKKEGIIVYIGHDLFFVFLYWNHPYKPWVSLATAHYNDNS